MRKIALSTSQSRDLASELCCTYPQHFSLNEAGTQLIVQSEEKQEEEQLGRYITQFEQEGIGHHELAIKSHQELIEELTKALDELKALTREDKRFQLERFLLSVIDNNVERPALAYLLQNVQTYTQLRQELPHLFSENP